MVRLTGDLYGVNRSSLLPLLLAAAKDQGTSIHVNSGYRSLREQTVLYQKYLAGKGPKAAVPGRSPHQFRIAVDARWSDGVRLRDRREVIERQGLRFTEPTEWWHVQPPRGITKAQGLVAPYWKGLDTFPARMDANFPLAPGDFYGRNHADPDIWNGSEGSSNWHRVWAVQARLGLPFRDRDGIFGKQTEERVKQFQRAHDLKPDGILGPKTWSVLQAA